MPLLTNGYVSLNDANGFAALTVRPTIRRWPQYFGVGASRTQSTTGNFDLGRLRSARRPGRDYRPVVLETFTDLSLAPGDPNYA